MTSSLITAFRRIRICFLFVVFLACDSFDGDRIEPDKQVTFSKTEYYTLPGSTLVIDFKAIIKQAFTSVSLTVSKNPEKGVLTQIDTFLFKYTPGVDFVEGQDQFVFGGTLDDGSIIKSEPMLVNVKESVEEFPCGVHAIEDDVRLTTTDATVIHILNNDRICPGPELDVFIRLEPKSGDVEVTGDSIVYKPNSSIVGSDELVYGVRNADGDVVSYGLVSINEMKSFGVPAEMTEIFFIDNEIGFMAGGSSIFKTTDGGANWEELQYPEGEEDFYLNFNHIFFVDENVGFVAFSEHEFLVFPSTKCQGGWLMTTNGGLSWTRTNFETPVNSIVFASPLVGFIAISPCTGLGGAIFRTADGGNTWEQALSTTTYFGDINISLADENIGYVFEPQGIYVTKDGGTTWMYIAPGNYVTSLAVVDEDIVCASFNSAFSQVTPGPGTIFRSEGGSPFMAVSDYFHSIVDLEFSPSGDLGIAVGRKGQPILYTESEPLMISKSTDKGRTWNELPHLVFGDPRDISIPSEDVAYILCSGKIIKFSL